MGVQDRDWYKEHIRRKEREAHNPPSFGGRGFFGVRGLNPFIMLVLCIALFWGFATAFTRRAPTTFRGVEPSKQDTRSEYQRRVEQRQLDGASQRQLQPALVDQERSRLRAIAERDGKVDEARRAAARADDRKARAWAKFYTSPPGCDDAATMECVNDRIRAKRVFEAEFAKGAY